MQTGISLENHVATFKTLSDAMDPTIKKGTSLSLERYYYAQNTLDRWHVIFYILSHAETDLIPDQVHFKGGDGVERKLARPHFPYIKRVVGLPGETLQFTPKGLLVNDQHVKAPAEVEHLYHSFDDHRTFKFGASAYRVPDEMIFVMSDNVKAGIDSRHIGPIPARCVFGRCA